jgi:hypothetical protein
LQGKAPHAAQTPIVVVKIKGNDWHELMFSAFESAKYLDVEMKDFYDVIDYFIWYGNKDYN